MCDVRYCEDCSIQMHPQCTHTGFPRWCEDCFDKGLHKDMNDHWNNFFKKELGKDET